MEKSKNDVKKELHSMYEHGYSVEEIAENLSEDYCVWSFRDCPDWCSENANCHDCWLKCLKIELEE